MPQKFNQPTRPHSQHRQVAVTFNFIFQNPNPPHIWDATDREIEKIVRGFAEKNMEKTIPFNVDFGTGFIQADFVDRFGKKSVTVKSRECGLHGKPLNFWERVRYLLTGRYWR